MANPVAMPEPDSTHLLTKRGIDFCPPNTRQVGDPCHFSGGDGTPHACGKNNPAAIVSSSLASISIRGFLGIDSAPNTGQITIYRGK